MKPKKLFPLLCLIWMAVACDESLPTRIVPQNTIQITDILVVPEGNVSRPKIAICIVGENVYEDYFHGEVNLGGYVRVWWSRKPDIESHVPISNAFFVGSTPIQGRTLTLAPGEKFFLELFWHCYSDDGNDIIDMLDFSDYTIRGNIWYAKPEKFALEVEMTVFDQLGLISSES